MNGDLDATAGRTLTARSVILSVLLGTDPPRLPIALLVRTCELFGIAEGTTRTALSRMTGAGELVAADGWYQIAAAGLVARQARQSASRAARTEPWRDRQWRMAIVGVDGPRERRRRAGIRAILLSARLAELREGVWLRPDNLPLPPIGDARLLRVVPDGDPVALAAELWDLGEWAGTAEGLRRDMSRLGRRLDTGDTGALGEGFVLSAAVLRHFQHDPLLPVELLPAGWPGPALRADYDRYDQVYRHLLRTWFGANRS